VDLKKEIALLRAIGAYDRLARHQPAPDNAHWREPLFALHPETRGFCFSCRLGARVTRDLGTAKRWDHCYYVLWDNPLNLGTYFDDKRHLRVYFNNQVSRVPVRKYGTLRALRMDWGDYLRSLGL
jgi:hypothetical protein